MYLINTSTLCLERFDDGVYLPSYAILSHTWGDSEVTFEDYCLRGDSLREGHGIRKIRMTCAQAVEDGLAYAWVDTCCIDKRSSAELSEAINSMFRWYQKAEVCYAYLEDVEEATQEDDTDEYGIPSSLWNEGLMASSERQVAQSRWFTRGWTLQELLAPSKLYLYSRSWAYLGSKCSLRPLLATITGIDESALNNASLDRFSVAQRMSWAANRVTTRVEDLAYSLLGIFDVNMPMLYGEGEKAFVRLQEEIMKGNVDQSLFAWVSAHKNLDTSPSSTENLWLSIFASHPRDFKSPELVFEQQGSRQSSTLTNNGVSMHAPIIKFDRTGFSQVRPHFDLFRRGGPNLYLVTLNCYFKRGGFLGRRAAIVCQKVGKSEFVRCGSTGLYAVSYQDYFRAPSKDVYLLKNIPYYRAPILAYMHTVTDWNKSKSGPLFPQPWKEDKDTKLCPVPLKPQRHSVYPTIVETVITNTMWNTSYIRQRETRN